MPPALVIQNRNESFSYRDFINLVFVLETSVVVRLRKYTWTWKKIMGNCVVFFFARWTDERRFVSQI